MSTKKQISQPPAKKASTGRTKPRAVRPVSPAKPALLPVRMQFKAGKDL